MRAGGLGGRPCKIEESKREHFSVSTVGSPTKQLTQTVSCFRSRRLVVDEIEIVKLTSPMRKLPDYRWLAVFLGFVLIACNLGVTIVSTVGTNTPPGVPAQLFEGFYATDAEMSSFVTCAMSELPGPGKGYWLVPSDEFSQLYEHPTGITMGDIAGTYGPYDVFAIYVRFEGILSAEPGKEYGHLGLYSGEIQVTKVLEVSRHWVGSSEPERQRFIGCGVR